jgi:hypothetical protein
VVAKGLKSKSIPSLELAALVMGIETVMGVYKDLVKAICPIRIASIYAYTDSLIVLGWLRMKEIDLGKIERKNVFVNNKLNKISEECVRHPIIFDHVSSVSNPADLVTRCVSAKVLQNASFHRGIAVPDKISEYRIKVPRSEEVVVSECHAKTVKFVPAEKCVIPFNQILFFFQGCKCVNCRLYFH